MVNVIPVRDIRRHRRSAVCWCLPRIERFDNNGLPFGNGPLVVHRSADGREHDEEHGIKTSKKWATYHDP